MSKRIKERIIKSREEALAVLADVRQLTVHLAQTEAAYNRAIGQVNERYTPLLDEVKNLRDAAVIRLKNWAKENPEEFGDKRTIETEDGIMGHRLGNLSLELVGKRKWSDVLETLQAGAGLSEYIRTKAEVNKELLLDRRADLGESALKAIGVYVSQVDRFFVEPKIVSSAPGVTVQTGGAL